MVSAEKLLVFKDKPLKRRQGFQLAVYKAMKAIFVLIISLVLALAVISHAEPVEADAIDPMNHGHGHKGDYHHGKKHHGHKDKDHGRDHNYDDDHGGWGGHDGDDHDGDNHDGDNHDGDNHDGDDHGWGH